MSSEVESYGDKPAWTTFLNYHSANSAPCDVAPAPVVAVQSDASYYTINDVAKINYSAADSADLQFNY